MTRFVPLLAFALLAACGLADDERDDKNKRVYITFADPAFEAYCLEHFDIDHDGRISRYEAQRVLKMDCPDRGIAHMWEIGEFSRLERLDCSGNDLTQLDLRKCTLLQTLDCSRNRSASLDLDGLRALLELTARTMRSRCWTSNPAGAPPSARTAAATGSWTLRACALSGPA